MAEYLDVDPNTLRLPPSRSEGADPAKLARHLSLHRDSLAGMLPIEVTRCKDGELMINSGVTRATRVAKFFPGQKIRVVVIDERPTWDISKLPTIAEKLP